MNHTQALNLFKLGPEYSQSELDLIFQFEKRLLAQRLANPFEQESQTEEVKRYATELTQAHELLSETKKNSEKPVKNKKTTRFIQFGSALVVSAGLFAGSFILLSQKKDELDQQAALKAQQEAEEQRKQAEQALLEKEDKKTIVPSVIAQKKTAQQIKLENTLTQVNKELEGWKILAKNQHISVPPRILDIKTQADKLLKTGSNTQAQFLYDDFIKQMSEHKQNVQNYLDTFAKKDKLTQIWADLAQTETFTFSKLVDYEKQFNQVKDDLSKGLLPSHSRATLENINLIIELTNTRGIKIANMRKQYNQEKRRWKARIANSQFYKLTPSIKSLMQAAEQKKLDSKDFTRLETEVFPRLLNHFKQSR